MTPTDLEWLIEETARGYLHVRETKGKPNSSPVIDTWLAHCGQPPGKAYCAAFVSWVIWESGMKVPVIPRFKRTAGALRLLALNPNLVITPQEAQDRLLHSVPCVYVVDHGGGKGHAGFAFRLAGESQFYDISANTMAGWTDKGKDREGDGVFERADRNLSSVHGWLKIE